MTVYTYWGNVDEENNGTAVLEVQSGSITIGQNGNFTAGEYTTLSPYFILRPGAIPWSRTDFPWEIPGEFGATAFGGSENTPINTVVPAITGTDTQGDTLNVSNGSWNNSPTSYSYQWQNSPDDSTWTNISSAVANSYVLQSTDATKYIRCVVRATNASGTIVVYSNTVGPVTGTGGGVPVNSAVPVVTGTAHSGDVLTSSSGTWTNSPTGYTYQWQTSANGTSGWTNLSGNGAGTNSYTVQTSDVGNYLRCTVVAANGSGSGTVADSAATSQVTGAGSTITVVQSAVSAETGANTATVAQAFPSATTAGHKIIVAVNMYGPAATTIPDVTGVADTLGNTFTRITAADTSRDGTVWGERIAWYYADSIAGGADTVTATTNNGNGYYFITIWEVTPCTFDQCVVQDAGSDATASATMELTPGSFTPTDNNSLLLASGQVDGVGGTGLFTAVESGWTFVLNGTAGGGSTFTAYKLQTTATAESFDFDIETGASGSVYSATGLAFHP